MYGMGCMSDYIYGDSEFRNESTLLIINGPENYKRLETVAEIRASIELNLEYFLIKQDIKKL